ncbi:MAG: hypothetical protein SF029_10150 [bacterium]|nr:hypothetical protein [bacterium]
MIDAVRRHPRTGILSLEWGKCVWDARSRHMAGYSDGEWIQVVCYWGRRLWRSPVAVACGG